MTESFKNMNLKRRICLYGTKLWLFNTLWQSPFLITAFSLSAPSAPACCSETVSHMERLSLILQRQPLPSRTGHATSHSHTVHVRHYVVLASCVCPRHSAESKQQTRRRHVFSFPSTVLLHGSWGMVELLINTWTWFGDSASCQKDPSLILVTLQIAVLLHGEDCSRPLGPSSLLWQLYWVSSYSRLPEGRRLTVQRLPHLSSRPFPHLSPWAARGEGRCRQWRPTVAAAAALDPRREAGSSVCSIPSKIRVRNSLSSLRILACAKAIR